MAGKREKKFKRKRFSNKNILGTYAALSAYLLHAFLKLHEFLKRLCQLERSYGQRVETDLAILDEHWHYLLSSLQIRFFYKNLHAEAEISLKAGYYPMCFVVSEHSRLLQEKNTA